MPAEISCSICGDDVIYDDVEEATEHFLEKHAVVRDTREAFEKAILREALRTAALVGIREAGTVAELVGKLVMRIRQPQKRKAVRPLVYGGDELRAIRRVENGRIACGHCEQTFARAGSRAMHIKCRHPQAWEDSKLDEELAAQ